MPFTIRPAVPGDAPIICEMIGELANYERLSDEARPDEAALADQLARRARQRCEALLAIDTESETAIGFALYFASYSTFLTQWGLYLEDLYVRPAHRGRGVGTLLLEKLASEAVHRGADRLDWSVLRWNEPAIRFYRRIGARPMEDWLNMRLEGEALRHLAGVPPETEEAPEQVPARQIDEAEPVLSTDSMKVTDGDVDRALVVSGPETARQQPV